MVRANIRNFYTYDEEPSDPSFFECIFVAEIGTAGKIGAAQFRIRVTTPTWLKENIVEPLLGVGYIIMQWYDADAVFRIVKDYCDNIKAGTEDEMICQLRQLGEWEYADEQVDVYGPGPARAK